MRIPLLENVANLWERVIPLPEAAYTLSDHEGGQDQGWIKAGSGDELTYDRYTLMQECYKAYRRDPRAKNIIETYATYVIGDGYFVAFDSPSDQERWERFAEENHFDAKLEEIIRLTLVRGNHFVRIFKAGLAVPQIRHVSALDIGEILTDPDDAEAVVGYKRRGSFGDEPDYPAEEMVHFRIGKLGNYLWGTPLLEPVLPDLARYRAYLRAQSLLWRIWTSIPLIRKGKWSREQLLQRRNDFPALPPPGTILTVSADEEWEYPKHPGVGAKPEHSRELRLSIAAGVGLPEYMVHADSSQSNYASTLVAEAPAMRRFRNLQLSFAESFEELIRKALEPKGKFKFGFMPLIPRDTEKEINAWTQVYAMGAISWQTYLEKIGVDPAEEKERLRGEGSAKEWIEG